MQVVDRIACSGYSYVSPTLDKACNVVPLLAGIKQRIEPYAPPLIQKADMCVDTVCGVVKFRATALCGVVNSAGSKAHGLKDAACNAMEERITALRDAVTSTGDKAQRLIGESIVVTRVHRTSLALVDTLDILIDRYLPEPEAKDGNVEANDKQATEALIPRMLYTPLKIPVRMMHISISKARNGYDVIQVRIQWASQLTSDQKAKLQALIVSKSHAIREKVSSSSLASTLGQGKQNFFQVLQGALQSIDDGRKAVGVKCCIVCEQLHILQMKDWLLKTAGAMQQATMDRTSQIPVVVSHRAYDVISLIAGQDRATGIFTLVGKRLPFVKIAAHSSASTGALSDSSSHEAEQTTEPSTGATGQVSVPMAKLDDNADEAVNHEAPTALDKELSKGVEMQVVEAEKVVQEVDLQKETDRRTNGKAKKSGSLGHKKK